MLYCAEFSKVSHAAASLTTHMMRANNALHHCYCQDKGGSLIAAGGCKSHTAKVCIAGPLAASLLTSLLATFRLYCQVFDRNHGNALVGTIGGMDKGIFSLDFSCTRQLAIAGGDCAVRIFDVQHTNTSAQRLGSHTPPFAARES